MRKVIRFLLTIVGATLGLAITWAIFIMVDFTPSGKLVSVLLYVLAALFGAFILFILSGPLIDLIEIAISKALLRFDDVPTADVIVGTIGLILGLILAFLISRPISDLSIPILGNSIFVLLSFILYITLGILGLRLSLKNKNDIISIFQRNDREKKIKKSFNIKDASAKILDTSVIIDGRILDIINTGFLEGKLIVPEFVLEELQHIADSADDLKRQRGRRGLDIMNEIKNTKKIEVEITDIDYPDVKEVDSKILKLATETGARIFTNDYNLNKVADVQDLSVLNINDLANSLKPVVIPGESMTVEVIKEGKEKNQGIGYLDDGTMIVIENGRRFIGKTINVTVTSVLQTSAGKMIFVRP